MTTQLSKQDYLKKYLCDGDKKKKKKKKVTQSSVIKSKIIDDDIDLKNMKAIDSDDLEIYDLAEEAPQIVGFVDDRPEEMRMMSEYKNTKKWKIVADEFGVEDVKVSAIGANEKTNESERKTMEKVTGSETSPPRKAREQSPPKKMKEKSDSEPSPPRRSSKQYDSDPSPPRKSKKSPLRKIKREKSEDLSPPRKSRKHADVLPPRKIKKEKSDSDASPPRKSKKYASDTSPPRKSRKNYDSDLSPPRKINKEKSSSNSLSRKRYDSDSSPPRREKKKWSDSDSSPPRITKHHKDKGTRVRKDMKKKKSKSPEKDSGKGSSRQSESGSKSKNREEDAKQKNTLTGKKAGLQNTEELRKEIEELKEREKEMKANATGRNEAVVVRDRKTGMRIDPKEEARKRREKEERDAEKLAQYAVWGKGVKQVQDSQDKLKDDLYEMSKPLARYADDKDLDDMLRNKEWDGDPMLEYIRKKKKKNKDPVDDRPQYEGSYMPNRYGIRPGYRWDGVDRSNGYEKKWFEEQNAKKAREEEAFKWSTADM